MGVTQGKGKDIRRGTKNKKKLKSVFGLQDQDRKRSAHRSPRSSHWTRLPWRVHFRPDLLRKMTCMAPVLCWWNPPFQPEAEMTQDRHKHVYLQKKWVSIFPRIPFPPSSLEPPASSSALGPDCTLDPAPCLSPGPRGLGPSAAAALRFQLLHQPAGHPTCLLLPPPWGWTLPSPSLSTSWPLWPCATAGFFTHLSLSLSPIYSSSLSFPLLTPTGKNFSWLSSRFPLRAHPSSVASTIITMGKF